MSGSDTIPIQPVENPILCSPYSEPEQHWLYDTRTGIPSKNPGRRPASYWFKTERTGSAQMSLLAEEERDDLPLVNALRDDVRRWRESGWENASETTKKLLRHGRSPRRRTPKNRSSGSKAGPRCSRKCCVLSRVTFRERVDFNGLHPCEVGLQTYTQRIVGLLAAAIAPDDAKGEAPLLPRLNRYKPIGDTGSVHFKTVKPVQITGASHLNFVACDTGSWEQAAMFQLEKLAKEGVVLCYVRNDRLEFNIPYELYGNPQVYEPDFIVRLRDSVNVVLEIKGRPHEDTDAKHQAARRWVSAVNHWRRLGEWEFLVCREPQHLTEELVKLVAKRQDNCC